MSSLRRISSSRANGALSGGPVTLEGKQRSAMNALSHGLLARTTLMRGEWSEGLKSIFNQYLDRLAHNLILLRTAGKNEPSPISGHSAVGRTPWSGWHAHRAIPNEPSKSLKTMDRTYEGISIFGRT